MNLILCGLPGSGKSTVSQRLAHTLGWPCFETDLAVEKEYEKLTGEQTSCREIHRHVGEQEFRNLEKKVLIALELDRVVIDLGGGTLTNHESAEIVKTMGLVLYIKEDRETVFKRLMQKGMPSYLDAAHPHDSFMKLASEREPIYEKYANMTIDCTDLNPQEIVELIMNKTKRE